MIRSIGIGLCASALTVLGLAPMAPAAASEGATVSTGTTVSPNPWPQWQGPRRDNISTETGLLKQWPPGGPPLLWKAQGLGTGFSTVSIADGRIYTMGDLQDASYLIALDLDGKPVWKAKVGQTGGGQGYPGPRCEPTVAGDAVVALGQFGDLVCADAKSGAVRWHKNMKEDFDGQMMSGWGYAESPLVDGNNVICTPGGSKGTMIALDLKSGEPVWRCKEMTDPASYSSIVEATIRGRNQYIQLTGGHVFGVAADDGRLLWQAKREGKTAVIPTPIVKDDEVFVTSGYNAGCNLFKITGSGDKLEAKEVYANKNMTNHHGGVVLVNGYIYGAKDPGILTCLDFQTGEIKWKDRSVGKGAVSYADGKLYLREENSGQMGLIDATPEGYHLISTFDQPDRDKKYKAWPHPVIANGRLYLRDQDVLLCYDIRQK
ncbi:MAG TPA: PQQ-binding-like beta-propeller repeat protein [Tepidisphaeraceae bacterium]|jgi:outer membrane protein assembly factor BamB